MILGALLIIAMVFAPLVVSAGLKISND